MWSTLAGNASSNQKRSRPVLATPSSNTVEVVQGAKKSSDIEYIILDSGALITRRNFFNNFKVDAKYYMTPAAFEEVRDKTSRQFLQNFPHRIIQRDPSSQSIRFVQKWISSNSDFRSLSKVDRQVVALALTIELEVNGQVNICSQIPSKLDKKLPQDRNNTSNPSNPSNSLLTQKLHANSSNAAAVDGGDSSDAEVADEFVNGKMRDTGVRLASMKKIVPFVLSDFMTLTSDEYGSKYGKPVDWEKIVDDQQSARAKVSNDAPDAREASKIPEDVAAAAGAAATAAAVIGADASAAVTAAVGAGAAGAKVGAATDGSELSPSPGLAGSIKLSTPSPEPLDIAGVGSVAAAVLDPIREDANAASGSSSESDEKKGETGGTGGKRKKRRRKRRHAKTGADGTDATNVANVANVANVGNVGNAANAVSGVASGTSGAIGGTGTGGDGKYFNIDDINIVDELNEIAQSCSNSVQGEQDLEQKEIWRQMVNDLDKPLIPEKRTIDDAWNGEWISPDNYKPTNTKKRKKERLEDVTFGGKADEQEKGEKRKKKKNKNKKKNGVEKEKSGVVCITIDLTMQRIMCEMGIRVLTMSNERKFESNQNNSNNANKGGKRKSNYQPDYFLFRCYACFQFEENTNRTHCRWCGGKTYQRVGVYKDVYGGLHYRYFARDRYANKYLERRKLVPRGGQLVKFEDNTQKGRRKNLNNRRKKRRGYLNQQDR